MCEIKSAIVLKDRVYMPFEHDEHSRMLNELNIKDDSGFPNFVRVEINPVDGDLFNHDLNNWKTKVDQDYRPDWYDIDTGKYEELLKQKLQEWFDACFAINNENWVTYKNTRIFAKNSKVVARENSSVEARENSSVVARENSSVVARDNSSVVARENSSVVAWGNSSVVAWGKSSVEARENSQIIIPYSTRIDIKGIYDLATIKDLSDKPKIIVATDFEIVKFDNKEE